MDLESVMRLARLLLLLLFCVILSPRVRCAGALKRPLGVGIPGRLGNVAHTVLTTEGKECKFPFRLAGSVHHRCVSRNSRRSWCSLTHNFDRDHQWGYCAPSLRMYNGFFPPRWNSAACQPNPCVNGGTCVTDVQKNYTCVCPHTFTGPLCQHRKCVELQHLRHYDTGESWGRIHQRNVEQCKCISGGAVCERARYTVCVRNRCENGGVCRMIEDTGEEVCACPSGFTGQFCDINRAERCYRGSGVQYRGVVSVGVSGAPCLPWNSDLLFNELSVETVTSPAQRGLGDHAFCRNPDGDELPWCYTVSDDIISWEYCSVPSCSSAPSARNAVVMPRPSKPTPVCGRRREKRVPRGRIMGGTPAMAGAHPWMAALYIADEFCAGSLVAACWVVSAAHCFLRNPLRSQIRVVLGQHFFNDTGPNTRSFSVERYIFHPHYSQYQPLLHDITLVKLKKLDGRCAQKTHFIRPICLPDTDTHFPDHTCCSISGWGHMHEKANSYSHLREGVVKIIPFSRCSAPDVYGVEVRAGMMCAGSDTCVDACQGDSGGPLACERDGVSVLYGVISWGDGCGRTGKPGVYTLVPKYSDWIHSIVSKKRANRTSVSTPVQLCVGSQC